MKISDSRVLWPESFSFSSIVNAQKALEYCLLLRDDISSESGPEECIHSFRQDAKSAFRGGYPNTRKQPSCVCPWRSANVLTRPLRLHR